MDIGIIKTISGKYQIVDETDDNAPLIKFCNECNNPKIVEKVFRALVDYYTDQALKDNDQS